MIYYTLEQLSACFTSTYQTSIQSSKIIFKDVFIFQRIQRIRPIARRKTQSQLRKIVKSNEPSITELPWIGHFIAWSHSRQKFYQTDTTYPPTCLTGWSPAKISRLIKLPSLGYSRKVQRNYLGECRRWNGGWTDACTWSEPASN